MRRAPIVLTATILGSAGVLLFKPLPISALNSTSTSTSTGTGTSTSASGSSSDSSGSTSSSSGDSGSSTSTDPGSSSSDSSSGSSTTTAVEDGTYTGTAETVRFGTTQVKVTIASGKITDVVVVEENQNDQRSVEISENAFPTLRQEVLTKQSADVDTVSGATYTSDQYEASLQSALDQAHYTAPDGSTASTDVSDLDEGRGGGFGH